MAHQITSFDTAHSGTIHDAQVDYYGRRLATASADHSIRVWDVSEGSQTFMAELRGHEAPVWQVSWAHPKFGSLIASGSFDKSIIIWKEVRPSVWEIAYKETALAASVNSVSFAPFEYGLILASALGDGSILLLHYNGQWARQQIPNAHLGGVFSISWAPSAAPSSLAAGPAASGASVAPMRLASCGQDGKIKVWRASNDGQWVGEEMVRATEHSVWRDVAWRPNVGLPSSWLAAASEEGEMAIFEQETEGGVWRVGALVEIGVPVWRASWSVTGSLLAGACADGSVRIFKEASEGGGWIQLQVNHL